MSSAFFQELMIIQAILWEDSAMGCAEGAGQDEMAFRILGSDSGKRSAGIKGRARKGRMVAGKWIGTCSVIADGRVFIVGEVETVRP